MTVDVPLGLRKKLDRLTTPPESLTFESPPADWDKWLTEQVHKIAELKYPHSISLHTPCSPAICEMNCFMFALDVETDAINDKCEDFTFPGTRFMCDMIKAGELQATASLPSQAADGDILIYFKKGKPVHAGKPVHGLVISKWGSGPTHIWQHCLLEVPLKYGNDIRVFRPMSNAVDYYREWATDEGL